MQGTQVRSLIGELKNPTNQILTGEAVPLFEGNMACEQGHGEGTILPNRANTPLAEKLRHES